VNLGPKSGLVCVVDDDASVRKALGRLLRSSGYEVLEFASPVDFIDWEPVQQPVCVLLDITMPGRDGLQVQQEMRRRGTPWPVIAISGKEDDEAREAARQLGVALFLRKPIDAHALLDAIAWVATRSPREAAGPDRLAELVRQPVDSLFDHPSDFAKGKTQ
jgi:FixJ family two-component response regulator